MISKSKVCVEVWYHMVDKNTIGCSFCFVFCLQREHKLTLPFYLKCAFKPKLECIQYDTPATSQGNLN